MVSIKKRIDPGAYNALVEALAVIYWNKRPWARFLRGVFRDHPEILSGLDFENVTKRETASEIVDILMSKEDEYQPFTISLMVSISNMKSFPNLMGHDDSDEKIRRAKNAVFELKKWTQVHSDIAQEHEDYSKKIEEAASTAAKNRAFSENIQKLMQQFRELHRATDPQKRGKDFEAFINQLFGLFDLEPRCSYSIKREQIDGSFSFDTDDYILEARWWKGPIGRSELDVFSKKVERKGKNTLGLYISINGFTEDAIEEYSHSSPFISMDGLDFTMVLEERFRLDDLLKRKKRFFSETGSFYLPSRDLL
jgi:hypothetical protein